MSKIESREKLGYAIGEHYGDLLRRNSYADHQMHYGPTAEREYWRGQRDASERALFSFRDNGLLEEVPSWD